MNTKLSLSSFSLAVVALACGGAAVAADQPVIGLITKTETNPFFVKMKEGAQAAATAKGVKLLSAAGKAGRDRAEEAGRLAEPRQPDGDVERRAADVGIERQAGARFGGGEHVEQGFPADHHHGVFSSASRGPERSRSADRRRHFASGRKLIALGFSINKST